MVTIVIGILLLIMALFLIVAVLMQQGKNHNLSGTIAGGAETFFGKSKGQAMNKKLSVLTSIVAVVFVLLVCILYFIQTKNESLSFDKIFGNNDEILVEETTKADETTVDEHEGHDHEGHDHE
ncbi:MAG: preprotein translocase subunit SecG [Clostridia bacterium]|nr:preprotein translocase subunit SecG [Clostridia bacterium]